MFNRWNLSAYSNRIVHHEILKLTICKHQVLYCGADLQRWIQFLVANLNYICLVSEFKGGGQLTLIMYFSSVWVCHVIPCVECIPSMHVINNRISQSQICVHLMMQTKSFRLQRGRIILKRSDIFFYISVILSYLIYFFNLKFEIYIF